jgi:hypothetical protein
VSDKIRMDAYYYSFAPTQCASVDLILSAVACAGKEFHYTMDWCDPSSAYAYHDGATPVAWMQNAANNAAAHIFDLEAQLAQRDAALKAADDLAGAVTHEREMPCQDFAMQSAAALAVSNAIDAYRKARGQDAN